MSLQAFLMTGPSECPCVTSISQFARFYSVTRLPLAASPQDGHEGPLEPRPGASRESETASVLHTFQDPISLERKTASYLQEDWVAWTVVVGHLFCLRLDPGTNIAGFPKQPWSEQRNGQELVLRADNNSTSQYLAKLP
jgi:hypothetical protein